ncbi:exodeoxyribonuclease III [Occultella glacieicola]|uniref:Exodeoxyribonuclease III n=1 Tax=Occultella glacieicola TaxID=2518684 RepID=A0ABY2E7M7_9MICO|nr:exodeoxyribonuclease III [Occultella glacieicola]TDE97566.1 exodeoxyribonuclease III [Occultella glacieicola]
MLSIGSVNVNGIRAAFRRGMGEWIAEHAPDVLLLQEVRATDELLAAHLGPDWHFVHTEGAAKGRAGVAVAARTPFTAVRIGLAADEPEPDVGRWVEADLEVGGERLTVVSTYLHSGTARTPSMDLKFAHLDAVTARMGELAAGGGCVVVGGDMNIAHREVDLKAWKTNRRNAGFLPEERAYLDTWIDEQGWVDLGRRFGGEGPGPYSWWSWRGQAFTNDAGWRIDYQFATPALAERAKDAVIDRAATYEARFSDHAPVRVLYDL